MRKNGKLPEQWVGNKSDRAITEGEFMTELLSLVTKREKAAEYTARLFKVFRSAEDIFNAAPAVLMQILDSNATIVSFLKIFRYLNKYYEQDLCDPDRKGEVFVFEEAEKYFLAQLGRQKDECVSVALLDKDKKMFKELRFTGTGKSDTDFDTAELVHLLYNYSPDGVIISRNRHGSRKLPTDEDDTMTAVLAYLVSLFGIKFYDHIIVWEDAFFSYCKSGKLDAVAQRYMQKYVLGLE